MVQFQSQLVVSSVYQLQVVVDDQYYESPRSHQMILLFHLSATSFGGSSEVSAKIPNSSLWVAFSIETGNHFAINRHLRAINNANCRGSN